MAVDKVTSPYPKYTQYKDITNVAQGSSFTVDKTGFYTLYIEPASSATNGYYLVRTNGWTVAYLQSVGGGAVASLFYFEKGVSYTVVSKGNVAHVYLYF